MLGAQPHTHRRSAVIRVHYSSFRCSHSCRSVNQPSSARLCALCCCRRKNACTRILYELQPPALLLHISERTLCLHKHIYTYAKCHSCTIVHGHVHGARASSSPSVSQVFVWERWSQPAGCFAYEAQMQPERVKNALSNSVNVFVSSSLSLWCDVAE